MAIFLTKLAKKKKPKLNKYETQKTQLNENKVKKLK